MANRAMAASAEESFAVRPSSSARSALATVLGLDAVALAPDVVQEGGAQDDCRVSTGSQAELLEQPLSVHVDAPGVAGAVQPGAVAEPGVVPRRAVQASAPMGDGVGVGKGRRGMKPSIARGPDG